jgi:hypothetical protein
MMFDGLKRFIFGDTEQKACQHAASFINDIEQKTRERNRIWNENSEDEELERQIAAIEAFSEEEKDNDCAWYGFVSPREQQKEMKEELERRRRQRS